MAYTTLVAGTTITATWANTNVRDQGVSLFATTAARDAAITAPTEGLVSYQTDTNTITTYSGSAWSSIGPVSGALTSWTPVLVQSGGATINNVRSSYIRVGRMVTCWWEISVTASAGAIAANSITVSMPVPGVVGQTGTVGSGTLFDTSATARYKATVSALNGTFVYNASGIAVGYLGAVDFVAQLAAGDTLDGYATYIAASDA